MSLYWKTGNMLEVSFVEWKKSIESVSGWNKYGKYGRDKILYFSGELLSCIAFDLFSEDTLNPAWTINRKVSSEAFCYNGVSLIS